MVVFSGLRSNELYKGHISEIISIIDECMNCYEKKEMYGIFTRNLPCTHLIDQTEMKFDDPGINKTRETAMKFSFYLPKVLTILEHIHKT